MNSSTLFLCIAVAIMAVTVTPTVGEGGEGCPQLMCLVACTHGYEVDDNGCDICRCVDNEVAVGSFMKVSLSEVLSQKIETKASK